MKNSVCPLKKVFKLFLQGGFDNNISYEKIYWSDWFELYNEEFWTSFGPQLRSLSFNSCEIVKDTFLKVLSHCPELKSLKISGCRLQSW